MRTQDLMLMRYIIAAVWLVTGVLSMGVFPQRKSLELLGQVGLNGDVALIGLYGSASLDILLGLLTLAHPSRQLWRAQATLILAYSFIIILLMLKHKTPY